MQTIDKKAEFYLNIEGKEVGPLTIDELLKNGLTPDTLVWWQGAPNWEKADNLPELHQLMQQSQPTPGEAIILPNPTEDNDTNTAVMEKLMSQLAAKDLQVAQLTVQLEEKDKQLAAISKENAFTPSVVTTDNTKTNKTSNILIFLWIVINILLIAFWKLFDIMFPYDEYYYNHKYHLIATATDVIYWLSWLLLPLAITNKKLKVIGLILTLIIVGYRLFIVFRNHIELSSIYF
ncbi:MAG: DUF4339 domain-containing protein [Muribaculaceae bacterium]|nr:DUF4339 domain-containing protein [Muribaculaceae bacterium]